jgi:hypothetical protein
MSDSDGNVAIPRLSCNCNRKKISRVIPLRSCRKKEDGCQDSKRERESKRFGRRGTHRDDRPWLDRLPYKTLQQCSGC